MKPKTSDAENSKSSDTLIADNSVQAQFVVCLDNKGYEVSLEKHKIYWVIPDTQAAEHDEVRIIDESGEDYLFPVRRFAVLDLPPNIQAALANARQ